MSTLDFLAARAVAQARTFERTVHDRGPWSIQLGDLRVGATRVRQPSRVTFIALFDEMPTGDITTAWLYCADELLSSKDVTPPEVGGFALDWIFGVSPDPVGV